MFNREIEIISFCHYSVPTVYVQWFLLLPGSYHSYLRYFLVGVGMDRDFGEWVGLGQWVGSK